VGDVRLRPVELIIHRNITNKARISTLWGLQARQSLS
jgi:hypothetical protein